VRASRRHLVIVVLHCQEAAASGRSRAQAEGEAGREAARGRHGLRHETLEARLRTKTHAVNMGSARTKETVRRPNERGRVRACVCVCCVSHQDVVHVRHVQLAVAVLVLWARASRVAVVRVSARDIERAATAGTKMSRVCIGARASILLCVVTKFVTFFQFTVMNPCSSIHCASRAGARASARAQ
jgi:hypothetical protein